MSGWEAGFCWWWAHPSVAPLPGVVFLWLGCLGWWSGTDWGFCWWTGVGLWWCSAGAWGVLKWILAWCGGPQYCAASGGHSLWCDCVFLLGVWICIVWVGKCVVFRGVEVVCLPHAVSFSVFANTLTLSFLMYTWSYSSLIEMEGWWARYTLGRRVNPLEMSALTLWMVSGWMSLRGRRIWWSLCWGRSL